MSYLGLQRLFTEKSAAKTNMVATASDPASRRRGSAAGLLSAQETQRLEPHFIIRSPPFSNTTAASALAHRLLALTALLLQLTSLSVTEGIDAIRPSTLPRFPMVLGPMDRQCTTRSNDTRFAWRDRDP
jgi:hypothetical protein